MPVSAKKKVAKSKKVVKPKSPAKKKVAKPKKVVKSKVQAKKEPKLECGVCGYRVIVDGTCGCVEEHVLVCCDQPMNKK